MFNSDVGYVRMFAPETVADSRARKAVARVTMLCCVVSVIVLAKSVWAFFTVPHDRDENDGAQYIAISISCLLSLMIPACGYFGARDKNRNLLSGFLACNACCVVTILFDVVLMIMGWAKYRGLDCSGFSESSAQQICENYNEADATDYWCFATVQIIMAAVYSVAAYWAWGVKQMPYFVQMDAPGVEFSGGIEMQTQFADGIENERNSNPTGMATWAQPATGMDNVVPIVAGVAICSNDASVPTACVAAV